MIKGHGGDIYATARMLGCRPWDIVDLSSNINPLGMPPGLLSHLKDHMDGVGVLPEVDGGAVISKIGGFLGVDPRLILAGTGTTQFIYMACPALGARKVLVVGPTYADYADACRMHRIAPEFFLADVGDRFDVNLDKLDRALDDFDTVFICNPNNPTGRLIPRDPLAELCRAHPATHFIVDESYLNFVPEDRALSMAALNLENVSVLWSISKIFGVPGLRAGFLIASDSVVSRFSRFMQPWSLNSMAQVAVDWVGEHQEQVHVFIRESRQFLETERQRFLDGLEAHTSATVVPSLVSYFLIRLSDGSGAADICARMAEHRFLIRNCSNFHGLSDQYVRVALKDTAVNRLALDRLINAMA